MVKDYKEIKVKFGEDETTPEPIEVVLDETVDLENTPEETVEQEKPVHKKKNRSEARIRQLANEKRELSDALEASAKRETELRKQLQTGNKQTQESFKESLEREIAGLIHTLKEAMKNGDSDIVISCQDALIDAKMKLKEISMEITKVPESPVQEQRQPQQKAPVRAMEWVAEHPEFNEDPMFNAAALAVNNQLLREGYNANEDDFYDELDTRLSKRFPELFGIADKNEVDLKQDSDSSSVKDVKPTQEQAKPRQTVSSSSRSPNAVKASPNKSNTVQLSADDVAQANRWGISVEQMARRMLHNDKHRSANGYVPIKITKE